MIQVLSVEDQTFTRSGIRQVLDREGDFAPLEEADDDREALQRIAQGGYDVVVLDLGLPGAQRPETLTEIRRRYPALPVLILTAYPEKRFAIRALKAGANGYLTKAASPGLLVHAIRQVASGRRYMGPEIAEMLAAGLSEGAAAEALHESLSDREFQATRAIATGKTVSDIARTSRSASKPSAHIAQGLWKRCPCATMLSLPTTRSDPGW